MRADQLMTRNVAACRAEESLERAAQVLWECDCGCAPVVDDQGRVVGIITDRDICMGAYTQGLALRDIRVASVMSPDVHVGAPGDPIDAIEATMRARRVRRIPIVDDGRRLVGLISINDLAQEAQRGRASSKKEITAAEVAKTLAEVCRPRFEELPAVRAGA